MGSRGWRGGGGGHVDVSPTSKEHHGIAVRSERLLPLPCWLYWCWLYNATLVYSSSVTSTKNKNKVVSTSYTVQYYERCRPLPSMQACVAFSPQRPPPPPKDQQRVNFRQPRPTPQPAPLNPSKRTVVGIRALQYTITTVMILLKIMGAQSE